MNDDPDVTDAHPRVLAPLPHRPRHCVPLAIVAVIAAAAAEWAADDWYDSRRDEGGDR